MPREIEQIDTIIVGGGQAGLAMSYLLTQQDRDHVILEKNERVGESWRKRWDSFTLVTPNWQLQLPGHAYDGNDPDGFLTRDEVVEYLEDYVEKFDPPLEFGVEVTDVIERHADDGYLVLTDDQSYAAENVVIAVGSFQSPSIPAFSRHVPDTITHLHSSDYRSPQALPAGAVLVVGSGQSGCQIAQELHESGREVYLSTGRAGRLPRRYRGRDGMWWALKLGILGETVDELDSPAERFAANPQISGKDGGQDLNLHQFARDGMHLLGHLEDIRGRKAVLAADLYENLTRADTMAAEFRQGVDTYVEKTGMDVPEEQVTEPADGFAQEEITELDLIDANINTIIWATGFNWDFSWIDLPIADEWGYPRQERGVAEQDGLYFVGLHFLHSRQSALFLGVGEDAAHIAAHLDAERAGQEAAAVSA